MADNIYNEGHEEGAQDEENQGATFGGSRNPATLNNLLDNIQVQTKVEDEDDED
jgi:hypothetical protein